MVQTALLYEDTAELYEDTAEDLLWYDINPDHIWILDKLILSTEIEPI